MISTHKRTQREQSIEQIAGLIHDCLFARDGEFSFGEAHTHNKEKGWTFEVRFDTYEYLNESDYTLVSDCQLDPSELTKAYNLAQRWFEGDFTEDELG